MKVLISVPVVVDIGGRADALAPGKTLDLPKDLAESLIKAGHAESAPVFERAVHPAAR